MIGRYVGKAQDDCGIESGKVRKASGRELSSKICHVSSILVTKRSVMRQNEYGKITFLSFG